MRFVGEKKWRLKRTGRAKRERQKFEEESAREGFLRALTSPGLIYSNLNSIHHIIYLDFLAITYSWHLIRAEISSPTPD
jgi:hypothetical protein